MKQSEKKASSKVKSINLDALIKKTEKESEILNEQNNMTSSVDVAIACEVISRYPNGVSPQQVALDLGEMSERAITSKQVRNKFQDLGLAKGKKSKIVCNFGEFAYAVSLTKNGNRNIYKVEQYKVS